MKSRTVYVAEWVESLLPAVEGKDFDPRADVIYRTSEHATFDEAKAAALANEGGYGFASVTTEIRYRDGHTSSDRRSVL